MSRSPAIDLLTDLRARGIELSVAEGRLRFRPSRAATAEQRSRMALLKAELIELVQSPPAPTPPASDAGNGDRPNVSRCHSCGEGDFTRPRAGGKWQCARCTPYDLASEEIEWWPRLDGPFVSLDVLLRTRESGI